MIQKRDIIPSALESRVSGRSLRESYSQAPSCGLGGRLMRVRSEVESFAAEMEKKLRKNDHKRSWKVLSKADVQWFLDRLKDEVIELEEAIDGGDPEDVAQEAADVGNFAMMIMDVFRRSEENGFLCDGLEQATRASISGSVRA